MRDLSLHLLDLIQNALKAEASRIEVIVEVIPAKDQLMLSIADNGRGMPPDLLGKVTDPFVTTRTTRSVGLGLPLLKEQCEQTGGQLQLQSEEGRGTILTATLGLSHIDRLPLGELSETFAMLVIADPDIDYQLTLQVPEDRFELDWVDMRKQLADVQLNEHAVLDWIKATIAEQQVIIFGGVLHEIISRTGKHSETSES